jgi:hypothetical protein
MSTGHTVRRAPTATSLARRGSGIWSTEVGRVASFDRAIDRVDTVERVEPPAG